MLGHHVEFKVCLVSKPLVRVVFSNFCRLFCRLFKTWIRNNYWINTGCRHLLTQEHSDTHSFYLPVSSALVPFYSPVCRALIPFYSPVSSALAPL